ncbi:low molecular weight protein-tyrosine-phosphatase [Propionibacteriaceae bacterium Y2011]
MAQRMVLFVCWGNICRSPMAERMAESAAAEAGLDTVRFSSAGVSSEEEGSPIDPRAVAVLSRLGCRTDGHRAHRITLDEARDADMIICAEQLHADMIMRLDPALADKLSLVTDHVPGAEPGSPLPDPWYGAETGFDDTAETIDAALPAVLAQLRR